MILDLDCIGEDEMILVHSEPDYPIGFKLQYDPILFELLRAFAEDSYPANYKTGESPSHTDNQELLHAGYRVMGLLMTYPETGKYPKQYHTNLDTIEKIKWDKVEVIRDFLVEFVRFLDFYIEDNKI